MIARRMKSLDSALADRCRSATDLALAGEMARRYAPARSIVWRQWSVPRLEALYELAFLRAFLAWEEFLETTFYRCLCGHVPRNGMVSSLGTITLARSYHRIVDAEAAVLSSSPGSIKKPLHYVAWYKCSSVLVRCQTHITNGHHEATILSHQPRLECYGEIRHRIVHHQKHAKTNFDMATGSLAGKSYRGSRPGAFLRDWDLAATPNRTWLETILYEFANLASQIA